MLVAERWLGLLVVLGLLGLGHWLWRRGVAWALRGPWRRRLRPLRPRPPQACPACRAALATPAPRVAPTPVPPWREPGRRCGRPKAVPTAGFACPNPACVYAGVTDASVHALVGHGRHGRAGVRPAAPRSAPAATRRCIG